MLSPIDERLEEDLERSDSTVQRLNIADAKKRTLPEFIGGHGPWQFRQWTVFFLASVCNSLHLFSTFPLSAHNDCCAVLSGSSGLNTSFNHSVPNSSYSSWSSEDHNVQANSSCNNSYNIFISTHQDHVCSYMRFVMYAKYIYWLGLLLSGLTTQFLAYKLGRRAVILVSGLLLFAISMSSAMSTSSVGFLIMRLVISMSVMHIYLTSVFSLVECVGEEYRLLYGLTGHLGWGLAHFILPLVTWIAGDWMQYSIILSCMSTIPLVLFSFFIPESVEASVSKGLRSKSQKLIRAAAWKNGYSTDDLEEFTQALSRKDMQEEMKEVWKRGSVKRAFELSLLFLVGFSASFLYFVSAGLTDWARVDRGGCLALAGTTEVAAVLVLLFATCFFSPKTVWSAATVMASTSILILYARSTEEFTRLSSGSFLLTMFFSSVSWTIVLVRTLFQPLVTTNSKWNAFITGVAMCSGAIVASLSDLQKFHSWSPKYFVIYAIPNLTIGATITILPERYFSF